jgi:aspartyl-tRNA(Asn)/glutamyl-tRNA(Gln) amidotransferase subunit A
MATSLDCVGVFARSAMDCAVLLEALSGRDPRDATSAEYSAQVLEEHTKRGTAGLRIALVDNFYETGTDAEILARLEEAALLFKEGGAVVETVRLPLPKQALAAYTVLSSAEASSNLSRYDGVRFARRSPDAKTVEELYSNSRREGFGDEVKRRILFGTDMLLDENRSFYYVRAQRVREMVREEMGELLRHYDLILTPTSTTPAFKRGERPSPAQLYYADLCTVYANLSGCPALSIPFGKNREGIPLAIQLTARPMEEGLLMGTARFLEEVKHEYFGL